MLGPGLLESVYEQCLAHELRLRDVSAAIEAGYRLDMFVDRAIIVEIKAVDALTRLHEAQILTHLKLIGHRLGFLMNFNVPCSSRASTRR